MGDLNQPISNAERMRRYRSRQSNLPRSEASRRAHADRQRRYRARRREQRDVSDQRNQRNDSHESGSYIAIRDPHITDAWRSASVYFTTAFRQNPFGYACDVCDRLWFMNDLKGVKDSHISILEPAFKSNVSSFSLCVTCYKTLEKNKLPLLSKTNGFTYPPKPIGLPELNPISTRLISPRIPFMAIRRLRRDGQYGIIGQVINIPIDLERTVATLPRQLDDDYVFNVSIKRKLIHKSSYLSGSVKKGDIKKWLEFLVNQPLYRHLNIKIDWSCFDRDHESSHTSDDLIDELEPNAIEPEVLAARQQTLLWNEENVLNIAPGSQNRPLNIIFDHFAEELSFPNIYYGVARKFSINATPYMMANSEIRRKDRRGVTPEHILYMAMKILRLRVVDGIRNTFRCIIETENITRRMLDDKEFMHDCIERNLSFLKSIPNSAQYWLDRKKDLFAMMRQIGKPTVFLTLSANEINWPDLISTLYRLNDYFKGINMSNPLIDLDKSKRALLVNEDPVTCCVYFDKLVAVIMNMLVSNRSYCPFGKYRVVEYFKRIEFQHRGSPHAHILLWLENDPKENVSEFMPNTIQLVTDLCSVSKEDVDGDIYLNQVHKHTFTCTKRGETSCRFKIPYWPMKSTQVLIPMAKGDRRMPGFRLKLKKVRKNLEVKVYDSIEAFFADNNLSDDSYFNILRSSIQRPTLFFKRDMSEIMTNTFNPWIASVLNSNSDLQFILDEYSCANYVVDYVNKSNRGTSNLHRELIKLNEAHPDVTEEGLYRKLGAKVLNTVELSAQEASWYLLRQDMSHCSRDCIYISTNWPCERQKAHKTRRQLDQEGVESDSTNIWTKSVFQKYEERPSELRDICLADFAAWYTSKRSVIDDSTDDAQNRADVSLGYYKRDKPRIIRYRHYDLSDSNNFKREMVTLFHPFDNELVDILDRNNFLTLYDQNLEDLLIKRREYESGVDIELLVQQIKAHANDPTESTVDAVEEIRPSISAVLQRENFVRQVLDDDPENVDDFDMASSDNRISAIGKRANVMAKADYCEAMRNTNDRQRELLLEFIYRQHSANKPPIQVFFTGPAGCGKTFTLNLIMETVNRYNQNQNSLNNAYVACASTGRAAVSLGGTTVHSAFHISNSLRSGPIAREQLHRYRQLFNNVKVVIIDEISMVSFGILSQVNRRLQEITGELDEPFGGMDMVICGDFRQLPPVCGRPVYKGKPGHMESSVLWHFLSYFPLHQVMRQSDAMFSSILTKIGDGCRLLPEESQLIESRFRFQQWCDENLQGVVRLFHLNDEVDAYNRRTIRGSFEHIAEDIIVGYKNNDELIAARTKLHKMSTTESAGLPYSVLLSLEYPYMVTSNIDVEDRLVNGAIGILKFIERCMSNEDDEREQPISRVWLHFQDTKTGCKARIKVRPIVANSRGEIHVDWTPISMRSASITLNSSMRCKRRQLPLRLGCAITIHKSQGATFDRAVIQYDKRYPVQLIYVALSRVRSIDGLYLTNAKNDFKFYHSAGSNNPTVEELRNEYTRLGRHRLQTLKGKLEIYKQEPADLMICTINAQSLLSHVRDIESDRSLSDPEILIITETWMPEDSPVTIDNYLLVNSANRSANSASTSCDTARTAGGVAIYRKINSGFNIRSIDCPLIQGNRVGDACLTELKINDKDDIIVGAIYIHPKRSRRDIEKFLLDLLGDFSISRRELNPLQSRNSRIPLIITGDFNINIQDERWIIDICLSEFNLEYVCSPSPTTLGRTTIDLVFVRNIAATCMPYISYFSYHRPLFTKINIKN